MEYELELPEEMNNEIERLAALNGKTFDETVADLLRKGFEILDQQKSLVDP